MRRFVLAVCALCMPAGAIWAHGSCAPTRIGVGQTAHFTLDKGRHKDYAVELAAGKYYVVWDLKRVDEKIGAIIAKARLLKSHGSIMNATLLDISDTDAAARVRNKLRVVKPFGARIRVRNEDQPLEVWMTIVAAEKMKWMPFAFGNGDIKPLGIGPSERAGRYLESNEWAYHSIKLPAGEYDVSLYFKAKGGNGTLIGSLERLDRYGFRVPGWKIHLLEIGEEARREKELTLAKPRTVIFRVLNRDRPVDYVIGIEKD